MTVVTSGFNHVATCTVDLDRTKRFYADAFVDGWATRLAAGPPIALAQSKRLLNNAIGATLEQALDEEGAAQTVNFATKDTAEAVSAFLEKRDPTFQGR